MKTLPYALTVGSGLWTLILMAGYAQMYVDEVKAYHTAILVFHYVLTFVLLKFRA